MLPLPAPLKSARKPNRNPPAGAKPGSGSGAVPPRIKSASGSAASAPTLPLPARHLDRTRPVATRGAPLLKRLKTKEYVLSLPTSAQLRMVLRTATGAAAPGMDAVMKALDAYNRLAGKSNQANRKPGSASSTSRAMKRQLGALDQALAAAIMAPGQDHAGALTALRAGLRDAEALRGLRTDWRYWEMLGVAPAEFDEVAGNPEPIMDWLDRGFSAKEALSFRNAGWQPEQVLHLKGSGVTGPLAKELHRFGYGRDFFEQAARAAGKPASALAMDFVLGNHHDAWAENAAVAVGSGAFNTPARGNFIDPGDQPSSGGSTWVFKKEQFVADRVDPVDGKVQPLAPGESHQVYEKAGGLVSLKRNEFVSDQELAAPRLGARNVAAWRLAKKIGWPVIVETEFSARTAPLTSKERREYARQQRMDRKDVPRHHFSFGIMMRHVKARFGYLDRKMQLPADPVIDARMRRNLVKLQLLDMILGQADRHVGNILIDADGNVQGIDNDQCLPDELDNPWKLAGGNSAAAFEAGLHGLAMPWVIDREIRADLLAFTVADLRAALGGLATAKQIAAAAARLRHVQEWVRKPDVMVIQPGEWGKAEVTERLRWGSNMDAVRMRIEVGGGAYLGEGPDEVDSSHYGRMLKM